MTERLQAQLHALAEEAVPADLTERVHRTARKLRRRRIALSASGTAAMVAAVALLVHMVSSPVPAPAVPPRPVTPTPSATVPPGSVMYVAVDVEGYQQNSVYARTPDGKMRLLGAHQEAIMGYVKLSPDGTKLAGFNESGRLQVADLDGRHVRTVATGVYSGTGHCEPVRWLTSRRLVYATGHDIRTINVDGTGGTRLTSRQNGCVPAISPDGRTVVSIDPPQKDVSPDGYGGGERLLVMSPTGSGQQVVPLPAAEQPLRIGQFSPDGRWFDAEIKLRSGSENGGIRLFDARTHRAISLPVTGRVNELSYLPDGGLVVQTCGLRWDSDSACSMVTLDRELKVTGQFRETKQMLGLGFIGITPRRP